MPLYRSEMGPIACEAVTAFAAASMRSTRPEASTHRTSPSAASAIDPATGIVASALIERGAGKAGDGAMVGLALGLAFGLGLGLGLGVTLGPEPPPPSPSARTSTMTNASTTTPKPAPSVERLSAFGGRMSAVHG